MDAALQNWLLDGDVAIQYQVWRDLLHKDRPDLQARILKEGWGKKFLSCRKPEGYWGGGFYQVKWISSHYSILDIRNLCPLQNHPLLRESIYKILAEEKSEDGGVNPGKTISQSDVCINGMVLNYASYFQIDQAPLASVVDFLLKERMPDGGFNCRSNRSGATHSSLHTTISVLEGLEEYFKNGYAYRKTELEAAKVSALDFILLHQLYISDRTGEIIKKDFLRFPYPYRWKYDILRALDFFQYAKVAYDPRMEKALHFLFSKRTKNGKWKLNAAYPGKVHFNMEKAGEESRWNTLRALRVLEYYQAHL